MAANGSFEGGPRDLKQVWFPGNHSDVDGVYPEAESGLSKIALEWMIQEAIAAGLLVAQSKVDEVLGKTGGAYVKPNANAVLHDALKGWWRLAEYIPKRAYDWATGETRWRMNRGRRRTLPPKPLIHEAAYQRGEE